MESLNTWSLRLFELKLESFLREFLKIKFEVLPKSDDLSFSFKCTLKKDSNADMKKHHLMEI